MDCFILLLLFIIYGRVKTVVAVEAEDIGRTCPWMSYG